MARQETDKEDLLHEATALLERIELLPTHGSPVAGITAGFRPNGAASFFFGADPVYHFNAAGELRRAYCDDLLYKANRGRLVSLRRVKQPGEVQLLRHELTEVEQCEFLTRMQETIAILASALAHGTYQIVGQVPEGIDVAGRLKAWLACQDVTKIAVSPHVERHR
jgi:hypothetical protein